MPAKPADFDPSANPEIIIKDSHAVKNELSELGLTTEIVHMIADAAASARADTMPVEPINAPGTNAYNKGVAAKRLALLPLGGWRMSHSRGIEATVNDKLGIQLVYQSVDVACTDRNPQAVSEKGSGSRKLVFDGMRQTNLFERVEERREQAPGVALRVWLVCVSTSGKKLRAEVSCPQLFDGNQFDGFSKRIFVVDQDYDPALGTKINSDDDGDAAGDFEVKIVKR